MKIFETPVMNIKNFNRVNILTVSGEIGEPGQTAAQAAHAKLNEIKQNNPNLTILNFALEG